MSNIKMTTDKHIDFLFISSPIAGLVITEPGIVASMSEEAFFEAADKIEEMYLTCCILNNSELNIDLTDGMSAEDMKEYLKSGNKTVIDLDNYEKEPTKSKEHFLNFLKYITNLVKKQEIILGTLKGNINIGRLFNIPLYILNNSELKKSESFNNISRHMNIVHTKEDNYVASVDIATLFLMFYNTNPQYDKGYEFKISLFMLMNRLFPIIFSVDTFPKMDQIISERTKYNLSNPMLD